MTEESQEPAEETTEEEPQIEQENQEEESEDSLRDSLEAAMEEVDTEGDGNTTPNEETSTQEAAGGKEPAENKGKVDEFDHPFDSEDGKSYKSPNSWKPAERELWSKVPPQLQARIKASEAERDNILRQSTDARRTHEFMNQLGSSYAPVFAAEGINDVPTGIKGMVDTIALLQNGSPVDKATKMAQLISHYGIDINALDSALVGETPQNPQEHELQQLIDQKMQPVNQLLEQINQNRQQQSQQSQQAANAEVAAFKGEFLSDVRNDMADILDAAAQRGQQMTLQKAYDISVSLRPDLQGILAERKKNEELTGRRNSIGNKMNAASSISGNRGGMASGSDTLRGAIEDAWNQG